MHIWIFNPYEALPFEGAVRLRYASLAEALMQQGNSVTWWSADWSHGLKRRRALESEELSGQWLSGETNKQEPQPTEKSNHSQPNNLTTQLISVPAYHKNISLRRIWSHWCYARGIAKEAERYAEENGAPDVILFSVPPMEAGRVALKLGKKFGARVILDVMDAWPETLLLALPAAGGEVARFESMKVMAAKLLLTPYSRMMRRYCREAGAICAQSKAFAEHARNYGAVGEIPVFHLAAKGRKKEQLVTEEPGTEGLRPPLRLLYLGSMGRVYDLRTLVEAVLSLRVEGFDVELELIGEGEQREALAARIKTHSESEGIRFRGYLEGGELDAVMARADVGIIPMHPDSGVVIPYKGPHYLSFGLYVISSLPGELMAMLEGKQCGSFYQAGDVASLSEKIRELIDQPEMIEKGSAGATQLFQEQFESDAVHAAMAKWVAAQSAV